MPGVPAAEDAAADETGKGKPTVHNREALPTPRRGSGFTYAGLGQRSEKVGLAGTAGRRVSGCAAPAHCADTARVYQPVVSAPGCSTATRSKKNEERSGNLL